MCKKLFELSLIKIAFNPLLTKIQKEKEILYNIIKNVSSG